MHPIDVAFWTCFLLGAGYTSMILLMGGLGHLAGHVGHIGTDAGHVGHVDTGAGHVGHIDTGAGHVGHVDTGAGHVGHIDTGAGHVGHADTGAGHVGHADAAAHSASSAAEGRAGQIGLAHSLHIPHGHAPASDAAGDDGAERFALLTYLNPMAVAGFLLAFGGVGLAARANGAAASASAGMGVIAGYLLWLMANLLVTRVFAASEGTSHYRREDLVGIRGVTTAPVSDLAPGMVACAISGARQTIRAVAEPGEEIPVGVEVRIRRITKGTATVTRVD